MPPRLPEEEAIPLARFNQTKEGRAQEVYRQGLALRYGKKMQMISGLHYNFSFGESMLDYLHHRFGQQQERRAFIDTLYFRVARNYLRYRWLLIYLFGASPTFDPSYLSEPTAGLQSKISCCGAIGNRYRYATSLRVSRFGYANRSQQGYQVSYNSLHEYIRDLQKMLHTKSLEFARLGLTKAGRQVQLNTNVLQKESEHYASIRFKQRVNPGETQLEALARNGVGYLEIRVLDLNPLDRLGVSLQQLHFLQAFMLFCLFESSPDMTTDELRMTDRNHHRVALFGRQPGLKLKHRLGDPIVMNRWAMGLLRRFQPIARLMDEAAGGKGYEAAIDWAMETVWDRTRTPSATILRSMEESNEDHIGFGLRAAAERQALREFEEEKGYESDGPIRPIGAFDTIIDQGSRAAWCCC
jgi:glutamate--cysteine ligase